MLIHASAIEVIFSRFAFTFFFAHWFLIIFGGFALPCRARSSLRSRRTIEGELGNRGRGSDTPCEGEADSREPTRTGQRAAANDLCDSITFDT